MKTDADHVCSHGVAMDVHCCGCHSGFIFDRKHNCPTLTPDQRHTLATAPLPTFNIYPRKAASNSGPPAGNSSSAVWETR